MPAEFLISLSADDVERLVEALDSHEYWQLGDVLPRNNGNVFVPGDLAAGEDRYWDGASVTDELAEVIDEVVACRSLSGRLRRAAEDTLG
ncbi:MAG: hypothetical protein QOJ29_1563 [Thermoleophilaceae bacterium]|jgi:hypothetical protein|nr:hypothetical protein [Thermoleophilaceae bacterium]